MTMAALFIPLLFAAASPEVSAIAVVPNDRGSAVAVSSTGQLLDNTADQCGYSKADCEAAVAALGLTKGASDRPFYGRYNTSGCFAYSSGPYAGKAFYGMVRLLKPKTVYKAYPGYASLQYYRHDDPQEGTEGDAAKRDGGEVAVYNNVVTSKQDCRNRVPPGGGYYYAKIGSIQYCRLIDGKNVEKVRRLAAAGTSTGQASNGQLPTGTWVKQTDADCTGKDPSVDGLPGTPACSTHLPAASVGVRSCRNKDAAAEIQCVDNTKIGKKTGSALDVRPAWGSKKLATCDTWASDDATFPGTWYQDYKADCKSSHGDKKGPVQSCRSTDAAGDTRCVDLIRKMKLSASAVKVTFTDVDTDQSELDACHTWTTDGGKWVQDYLRDCDGGISRDVIDPGEIGGGGAEGEYRVAGYGCCSYSRDACEGVANQLKLKLGGNGSAFVADYVTKGCYAYSDGPYKGRVFFGTVNGVDITTRSQLGAAPDASLFKYRPSSMCNCTRPVAAAGR